MSCREKLLSAQHPGEASAAALRNVLDDIDERGGNKRNRRGARDSAYRAYFGAASRAGCVRDGIDDLAKFYGILTVTAGVTIKRPTAAAAAAALLTAIGLGDFRARFSHLTTRRKQAAHRDTLLLDNLSSAITKFDIPHLE